MLKRILKTILFVFLMAVYLVIYCLLRIGLWRKMLVLQLGQIFGKKGVKTPKMTRISRKFRVADIGCVTAEEKLDFMKNRAICYIRRMCLWTPYELVRTAFSEQKMSEISDQQLVYTLLTTVYAHNLEYIESKECYMLDMSAFDNVVTFKGFYWDVRKVYFKDDASLIRIVMLSGDELRSDAHDETGKANYRLARVHLQVCLSYFAPGLAHNHVHFVYPSAVCSAAKNCLNKKGTLYKLLAPHFRFTEQINYQALRVGKSTDNHRTLMDRFFFFWKSFPVTGEEFVEGVAKHCQSYYVEQQAEHQKQNGVGENHEVASDTHIKGSHCIFPPAYVSRPPKKQIPYHDFLRQYYHVVEDFVRRMSPLVDKQEWQTMSTSIAEYIPNFEDVDFVSAVATFIHQASIIHSSDHEGFARFIQKYGCMSMRAPYESYEDAEAWKDIAYKEGRSVQEIRNNPLLLFRQMDIMRTKVFANVFGTFVNNPYCDQRLTTTFYDFEQDEANEAAAEFINDLKNLESDLKEQETLAHLPKKEGEPRCCGKQLVQLNKIVRSISF